MKTGLANHGMIIKSTWKSPVHQSKRLPKTPGHPATDLFSWKNHLCRGVRSDLEPGGAAEVTVILMLKQKYSQCQLVILM